MKNNSLYSVSEVAELCHVTVRTLRYYDTIGLLVPQHNENGVRLYAKDDIMILQEVLTLKLIGFSLSEIKEIMENKDGITFYNKLCRQNSILKKKIEDLREVMEILDTLIESDCTSDKYDEIIKLIRAISSAEISLKQYTNFGNLEKRINLHEVFSTNTQIGWFEWCFEKMELKPNMNVLEVGCGNGRLWEKNLQYINADINIILSDIKEEMVVRAREKLKDTGKNFHFKTIDVRNIPFPDNTFDVVIANHMLYHTKDVNQSLSEIRRVLKPGGVSYMTTVGRDHLKELRDLLDSIDHGETRRNWFFLESFTLDDGMDILSEKFCNVQRFQYYDNLLVDKVEPIILYIKSMEDKKHEVYVGKKLEELRRALEKKVHKDNGMLISKQIGMLIATK